MAECTWYEVAGHLVYGVPAVEHSAHAGGAIDAAG